jgi:mono/diheme cytochrome c family protein
MLKGMVGEMEVRGVKYRGAMPSVAHLTDSEIADIATYVRSSWGNKASAVDAALVSKLREQLKGKTESWKSGEELRRFLESL